jgi:hypothetical protein
LCAAAHLKPMDTTTDTYLYAGCGRRGRMPNEFGPQAQGSAEADGEEADTADEDDEEDAVRAGRKKGLVLVYDVVRRFAQPLGIHLDQWERRIVEREKGVVRLLPVRERASALRGPGCHGRCPAH